MASSYSHDIAVNRIAASVGDIYARKEPFRIYHGSMNRNRKSQSERERMVDTSELNHILAIDTKQKRATVEPNVPMDALVKATLQHNLLPPVVMEFPGITVGDGFAGTAGGSSSFRQGLFDRTVTGIEIVLGNGKIVSASKDRNSDLFYGTASSFGTLGVTTLLEIQLIDSKSNVKLTYYRIYNINQAVNVSQNVMKDDTLDYLDGFMYAKDYGVMCVGQLTNQLEGDKLQTFIGRSDPWFYRGVEEISTPRGIFASETIPIVDYLFRHDRSAFWGAKLRSKRSSFVKYAYKYFVNPYNKTTRWILDHLTHTGVMHLARHESGLSSHYIIQDAAIPYENVEKFMDYLDSEFKNYPIRQNGSATASTHSLRAGNRKCQIPDMMLNFGVWGPGPKRRDEFVLWNQTFEQKVHDLEGQKWLFSHTYHTKEEFNKIYDQEAYNALREKYHAEYLPTVYDKVKVKIDITEEENANKKSWSIWPFVRRSVRSP